MTEAQLIQEEVDNFLAFTGAERPESVGEILS